jgi:hypothetical protein
VELVDRLQGGGRVVDAGGEGPVGDVGELAEAEGHVLLHGPLPAELDGGDQALVLRSVGPAEDLEQRRAGGHEVADPRDQSQDAAGLGGPPDQGPLVHQHDHAGSGRR